MDIYQSIKTILFISIHNLFHFLDKYCMDLLMGFLNIILHIVFKYLIYPFVLYLMIILKVHGEVVLMMYHCFK